MTTSDRPDAHDVSAAASLAGAIRQAMEPFADCRAAFHTRSAAYVFGRLLREIDDAVTDFAQAVSDLAAD